MTYKLGSLFDGSGGFPLSGALCGIEPTWAAEVEPYPIAVTRSRFPKMKHLGDISKVNGAEIEPVDIITFGSPCQDLSVAGKRAGLKHEANGDEETTRSGLFMEAVRIIKEMRAATNGEYPRFALWENVPGAFSSNKGEDFRIVCEELIKIVEPAAFMPAVPQKGWAYSDSYIGDGWSLAYRVFDAQYWGVPQRRRRIHLIVDFRGECAREILFEREGLRGYFAQGRTPWQAAPSHAQDCSGADDREGESTGGAGGRQLDAVAYTLKVRPGVDVDSGGKAAGKGALVQTEKAATLACVQDQYLFQPTAYSFDSLASNSMKSSNPHSGCRETMVAKTLDTTDPNPSKNQGGIAIVEPTAIIDNIGGQAEYGKVSPVNGTLRSAAQGAIAFAVENHPADSRVDVDETGKVQTLTSRMGTGGGNVPMVMEPRAIYTHPQSDTWDFEKENRVQTLAAGMGMGGGNTPLVMEGKAGFVDVEMEVAVRKYEVDCEALNRCLMVHKAATGLSTNAIAEKLDLPITQVAHWFRGDNYFAIPEPDIWPQLKKLLGIKTDEFDQSIMTLEFKGGTYDMRNRIHTGETSPTLTCGCGNDLHLVPTAPAVAFGFDQGATRDVGKLFIEEASKTLTNGTCPGHHNGVVIAEPAYAASKASFFTRGSCETAECLVATDYKDPQLVAYSQTTGVDCRNMNESSELYPTLQAKPNGGQSLNFSGAVRVNYIVRRLTPTECARLQGFADWHGHLEQKAGLTDEEYSFWMDVRNTHAAINGKAVKDYTKAQMLTWYNKLWTDAAEYKMWGNGIALPPALYCMQGIMDVLNREEEDSWML